MKDSFIVFNEHWAGMKALNFEQRGRLLTALMSWNGSTDMPELDPITQVVFDMMLPRMQASKAKYEETVEKRREAGRKGGNAKHANATGDASDTAKQSQAKTGNNEQAEATASNAKQCQAMLSNAYHTDPDPDPESTSYSFTPLTPQGGQDPESPVSEKTEPKKRSRKQANLRAEDFEAVWQAYPARPNSPDGGKGSKEAARKAWDKLCKANELPELNTLLATLDWQKKTQKWRDGYIENLHRYLTEGHWKLEKPTPTRRSYAPDERGRTPYVREDEMDFDSTPLTPDGFVDWHAIFAAREEASHA